MGNQLKKLKRSFKILAASYLYGAAIFNSPSGEQGKNKKTESLN